MSKNLYEEIKYWVKDNYENYLGKFYDKKDKMILCYQDTNFYYKNNINYLGCADFYEIFIDDLYKNNLLMSYKIVLQIYKNSIELLFYERNGTFKSSIDEYKEREFIFLINDGFKDILLNYFEYFFKDIILQGRLRDD